MRNALAGCALVVAIFTFGFASPAAALNRLVDDNLVPCASGGLPIHSTITDAVNNAAPGETIGVCPGTYAESVTIFTDDIVLQALGVVKVVTPGGAPGFGLAAVANGVTILGFDVSGFSDPDECGIIAAGLGGDVRNNRVHENDLGICVIFAESARVRNNVIENNVTHGIFSFIIDSAQLSTNTIRNNGGFGMWIESCDFGGLAPTDIHHNNITGHGGDGIYSVDCPGFIQNNTVRNNALLGPDFHGIHIFDSSGAVVMKNTVQSSNVGIFVEEVDTCTISFNSISFNTTGIDVLDSDGCTFARNNVSRSTIVDCQWDTLGTHTFTANACGTETPPGAWD